MNNALRSYAEAYGYDSNNVILYSDRTTAVHGNSWAIGLYDPDTGAVSVPKTSNESQLRFFPAAWLEQGTRDEWYRQAEEVKAAKEEAVGDEQRGAELKKIESESTGGFESMGPIF